MGQNKRRITVNIYNQSYTMIGKESEEHMNHIAHLVHDKMKDIRSVNHSLDTTQVAVLTAVNTMNDLIKQREENERLRQLLNKEEER
ncbi:MAG TPA: cell division protein ZapA [Bacillota bacterium]|nr:cell division protein ZapA [Bacillota bacterium]